jgi:hypothetical protein
MGHKIGIRQVILFPPFSANQKKFSILHSSIQKRSINKTTHTPNSTLKSHHTIIYGDSRQMNLLADSSVHLVVTSPPNWQLKDYGTENQIGFHESYESYINYLNLVCNECERATLQSPPKSRKSAQP